MAIVLDDLIVIGSLNPYIGASTEKACLPILSLVLRTKSCFETDDLKVLDNCNYIGVGTSAHLVCHKSSSLMSILVKCD